MEVVDWQNDFDISRLDNLFDDKPILANVAK